MSLVQPFDLCSSCGITAADPSSTDRVVQTMCHVTATKGCRGRVLLEEVGLEDAGRSIRCLSTGHYIALRARRQIAPCAASVRSSCEHIRRSASESDTSSQTLTRLTRKEADSISFRTEGV
eukprot:991003-Rhodomonas_salina.3